MSAMRAAGDRGCSVDSLPNADTIPVVEPGLRGLLEGAWEASQGSQAQPGMASQGLLPPRATLNTTLKVENPHQDTKPPIRPTRQRVAQIPPSLFLRRRV